MVLVLGPTGSGKSSLAIRIALACNGEVINCDSQQVYRGLDIGTAKVPLDERQGVPHHLIDVAEPDEVFSAGEYARRARAVLAEVTSRGRLPIVCGGTGFYVRALLEGLFEGPVRDEALRDRLNRVETKHPGFVHRLLRRLDPASARRIHANDTQKAVRAVEVSLAARAPMSSLFGQTEAPLEGYRITKIGLNPRRAQLYERINERCEQMFRKGLVEEVRGLLAHGYDRGAKALESIGYRQSMDLLEGRLESEQHALADVQMQTRRYAKRQMTWFRKDAEIQWLQGFGDDPEIQLRALHLIMPEADSGPASGHNFLL